MPERVQAQVAFRRVLFLSVVLPVVLMAGLAAILVFQITRLTENSRWVQQVDDRIARINHLEKLTLDLETGMRGYMIAGEERFLQPYQDAQRVIDGLFDRALNSLRERPEQAVALREIQLRKDEWLQFAEAQIERRRTNSNDWEAVARTGQGKRIMDDIRRRFGQLLGDEERARLTRTEAVARSTQVSVLVACGLTLLVGVLLAVLSRSQIGWLTSTFERALNESKELSASLERRVEERTRELSASNAQLGEANKELEAFAYSISHDLRAPMRHITGFAELLRSSLGKQLSADDAENLDTIYNTAVLAGRMVDDLLAFSRVGRTQLRMSDVDVDALVRQCLAAVAPETRGRDVQWKVEPLRPTRGDSALLKMVFQNLINNAVKYTQTRPSAQIEISSRAEEGGTTYIVRDNGVGFDMAYVHKLFGVFQRLHRSEDFEGTGIGLANVRRIITRHGGRVWAEAKPDAGATFYVHLPDDRSATDEPTAPATSPQS